MTERLLRDRVIHLLALRPYKRSELVLRLQRDGVTEGEGDGLEPVLQEVRRSSCRSRPATRPHVSDVPLRLRRWVS